MLDAGIPQVTGGGRVGILWELPAGRSGRRCLAAICHFEVKLCLLERGCQCYVDNHGLIGSGGVSGGPRRCGQSRGSCLPDGRQGVVHLPVFGPQVVKEGCIGERLDNDESEDANVASMSPKMNPNGGSSAGGSPVWNS